MLFWAALTAATAGIMVAAFWTGLVTRRYTVCSDKIREPIKIVLIADLHGHFYGEGQKNIAKKIKDLNPELILLGGDIFCEHNPNSIESASQFLDAVKSIADVYFVTGNHDMVMSRRVKNLKKIVRSHGATILENNYVEINKGNNNIIVGGIDDPGVNRRYAKFEFENAEEKENMWQRNLESSFSELKHDTRYKILLSHRPDKTKVYEKSPFDLILSGHAHGGQVRIPFILNGLYAPNQGIFPKYVGGMYEYGGKVHIVSRGTSFNIFLPRIFNPPEIVVITLAPPAEA